MNVNNFHKNHLSSLTYEPTQISQISAFQWFPLHGRSDSVETLIIEPITDVSVVPRLRGLFPPRLGGVSFCQGRHLLFHLFLERGVVATPPSHRVFGWGLVLVELARFLHLGGGQLYCSIWLDQIKAFKAHLLKHVSIVHEVPLKKYIKLL